MIKVAKSAKEKVATLMKEEGFNPSKDYVRVGVKSGGCSGLSYDLKFDDELHSDDKLFEDNQVKILVDKNSSQIPSGDKITLICRNPPSPASPTTSTLPYTNSVRALEEPLDMATTSPSLNILNGLFSMYAKSASCDMDKYANVTIK